MKFAMEKLGTNPKKERKKLAFNVRCLAFRHPDNAKEKFIELMFELANNGQRENRIYTLAV